MRVNARWRRSFAAVALVAMVATACGGGEEATDDGTTDDTSTDDGTDDGGDDGMMEIETGVGVTAEPCPNAVDTSKGCIYLGQLSDLTEGPFAALGVPITEAVKDFWANVNANGGIGGYEIDAETYIRDNKYNQQEHVTKLTEIKDNVLLLAQTLGTPPTLAALETMRAESIMAAPASWWSGWDFEPLILQSGVNYCIGAMNAMDYAAEAYGAPGKLMIVHYPGDYGGDYAAGVEKWAEANEIAFDPASDAVETLPNAVAGNQDGPVGAILAASPDILAIATGPAEMAEIVGKAAAQGFTGRIMGATPTWNSALLQSAAAPAIQALYEFNGPWAPWGADTAAHAAMQAATGGELPANDGYTFGWIWQYPVKALLEYGAENGNLTREFLLDAVDDITISYDGALPDATYAGAPNDRTPREGLIGIPDPEAPLGASVKVDFAIGATAGAFEFTEPCISLG